MTSTGQTIRESGAIGYLVRHARRWGDPATPAGFGDLADSPLLVPIDLQVYPAPAVPRLRCAARMDQLGAPWNWKARLAHDDRLDLLSETARQPQVICLFSGFIVEVDWRYDGLDGDCMVTAAGRSQRLRTGTLVYGRWMKSTDGQFRHYTGLPCHFNAEGRPNMAAETLQSIDGHAVPAFTYDGDPAARYWTASNVFSYLMWRYNREQSWISNETLAAADGKRLEAPVVCRCERLDLWTALAAAGDAGGYDVWEQVSNDGGGGCASAVRIKGRNEGAVKSLLRQGVRFGIQANLDPKKTENYSGSVAESQASVVNAPIVFGSRKIYEITVELGKAWLPALSPWAADGYHPARDGDDKESLYYSRYVVGGSAFGTGQMAGRLWDANTDGKYDAWGLTRRDVAALATAGNTEVWPAMPHKPLPLFSRISDLSNQVVRAWAEYSTAGSARQRLIAGWRMLTDRIGLYITQKDLADIVPTEYADKFAGNFFQALIDNAAAVRVWLTCAIRGPHRLMHSVARSPQSGSAFGQVAAFDRGRAGEFRFSQAGAGSPTLAGILIAKNHDGTADLVRAATRIAEVAQDRTVEATFELPWPEPEISIGDRIEKLEGLEYSFGINAGAARRYPRVVGLTYGLTPGNYNTQIVLESERKAGRI